MEDTHETAPGPTAEAIAERQRAVDLLARHIIEALPPSAKMDDIGVHLVRRLDATNLQADLLSALARFEQDCPFRRLDWITPRAHSDYNGVGEPMLVAEVLGSPITSIQHSTYLKYDLIILRAVNGSIAAYYAESWQFEPWVAKPKKDDSAAPS